MPRFKDLNWNLPANDNGKITEWEHVRLAVLMDIRDELKTLNSLLGCKNFIGIPRTLRTISRKIQTRRPRRRA